MIFWRRKTGNVEGKMKITILNGNPDKKQNEFDKYLAELKTQLTKKGHETQLLTLRDLETDYCTGCWSCWVKTPGVCIFEDDSHTVARAVINSDLVLFASPVLMGYISALLKKYIDKLIQLIHPYITVDHGEAHHEPRYDPSTYPLGALLLEKTPGTDDEDLAIIQDIQARTMLNFKSRNAFTMLTAKPTQEVVHAIDRL